MNCPSRTDDILLHPGWNQNPPPFASDLTTCQDLNGIANARELGDADTIRFGCKDAQGIELEERIPQNSGMSCVNAGKGASCPLRGPCTCPKTSTGVEYLAGLSGMNHQLPSSTFKNWAWWLLSVLCASTFISYITNSNLSNNTMPTQIVLQNTKAATKGSQPALSLAKRASCASGSGNSGNYNTPFHVGALFIILFVSSTACAFPVLVIKFPRLRIPASFLFAAKHFGTGVLIATAFVHLLPTAFISLGNPCLSGFWTTDYPAMPGAIALAGIFFVTVIEMVFSPSQHICSGSNESMNAVSRPTQVEGSKNAPKSTERDDAIRPSRTTRTITDGSVRDLGPLYGRSSSISRTLSRMGEANQRLDQIEFGQGERGQADKEESKSVVEDTERNQHGSVLTSEQMHKKEVMQCLLLEMGILFHSVFIGMSLSVSVGSEFIILLIAIVFHQTFEGLALGARIASLEWPENAIQPWLMALAYGCTTPVGQAIGLATHTLYSPDSEAGLLMVGIMNAISSGLLVFASLVELMSEDFLSDESWQVLRGKRRVWACILVFLGAFSMSLVGAWA
ncbi:Zip-domain-containing protein [Zopfia rhizophila CBS 207.26]|uniref:Zip-domain-containing protein n=1 Tax=Zopfia rhizophila CBS 207.26 TaxID=1314779 RepID=A0A6A6EJ32_9PEZI|nr:Zip-domain-containing protein [Zopfia rhizophila CBS 207.26]